MDTGGPTPSHTGKILWDFNTQYEESCVLLIDELDKVDHASEASGERVNRNVRSTNCH
jgi:hypothetical protein